MIPFQEFIESLHETVERVGIGLGDVIDVGANEDQAAGTALAFGGGNPGLGAQDLAFECLFPETLGRIKERIAGIFQEFRSLREKIREARERVKAWPDYERQKWADQEFRRESAKWAEITRKYYQAVGQPSRTTPRSTAPTRGHEPDRGPSR